MEDAFGEKSPYIGVLYVQILSAPSSFPQCELIRVVTSNSAQRPREEPELIVYSLSSHEVVTRRCIPGLVSSLSNASFIIIVRTVFAHFGGVIDLMCDIEHIKPSNSEYYHLVDFHRYTWFWALRFHSLFQLHHA